MNRIFFSVSLCLALSVFISCGSLSKVKQSKDYSVVMLGDVHYEKYPGTYHDGFKKMTPERLKAVKSYGQMWQDRELRLLDRAASLVDKNTQFVLQTGDMIMGYTKDSDAHTRFLDDGYTVLKEKFNKVPFVSVVGNHDIRGNSGKVAYKAYCDYMTVKMSEELGKRINQTTFSFNVGPDAYIVIDFNNPDASLIDSLLDQTAGSRYTFIVIHGPVFPYDHVSYFDWCLFGRGKVQNDELRHHFLERFAERNAIVLCGHTHKTEFADWYSPKGGRITQLTMSSVWAKEKYGQWLPNITSPEKFGSVSLQKIKKQGKAPSSRQLEMYAETINGLKTYISSAGIGSYKMNVTDKSVTVDFYPGDSAAPATTFVLR